MPTFTKMKQIDLKLFATALQQSYSALYGSPAADACLEASKKIKNCYKYWSTDRIPVNEEEWEETNFDFKAEAMNDLLPEEERVQNPTLYQYDSKLPYISEERIQELGVDEDIDKALTLLRQDRDNHPEGTLKRMLIDFAIEGFEKFRRRELVAEAGNPELLENPGADSIFKFANFTFVPKLGEGEGEDRQLPEGFPDNDKYDEDCRTKFDQIAYGKYTEDQLNEALQVTNLDNVYAASHTLTQAQRKVNNLLAQGNVDPARERIMKDNLLGAADALLAEYTRATQTDLHDERGLPLFDGNPEYMSDTLSPNGEGERSFSRDIASLQNYRNYLNSALPIAGFYEVRQMLHDLDLAKTQVQTLQNRGVVNHGPYLQTLRDLETAILNYPQDAEQIDAWKNNIRTAANNVVTAKNDLIQNIQFDQQSEQEHIEDVQLRDSLLTTRDHLIAAKNELEAGSRAYNNILQDEQAATEKINQQNTKLEAWEARKAEAAAELQTGTSGRILDKLQNTYIADLDHLGQRTREEKNRYIDNLMDGMQNDTRRMVNELKEFKELWFLGDRMKNALNNAIFRGAQDPLAGPDRFLETLKELKNVAGELHQQNPNNEKYTRIFNWAGKNAAYFESRVLEAQSKGILTSDSLDLQRQMRAANGNYHMQEALNRFNTRRHGFFNLFNDVTEVGAESPEHRLLREKTQQLLAYKSLSSHFDKDADYEQWRASLATMQTLARETYEIATAYLKEKGSSSRETTAGDERYEGAVQIRDEAAKMFMDYKTQFSVENSYRSLNRATERNQQIAAERVETRTLRDELRAQQALAAAAVPQDNAGQIQNANNIIADPEPQAGNNQINNNIIQNDEPEAGNNQINNNIIQNDEPEAGNNLNLNNVRELDEDDDVVNYEWPEINQVNQGNHINIINDEPKADDKVKNVDLNDMIRKENHQEGKELDGNPQNLRMSDVIKEAQATIKTSSNNDTFYNATARLLTANFFRIGFNKNTVSVADFNKRLVNLEQSKDFANIRRQDQNSVKNRAADKDGAALWKDFAAGYNARHATGQLKESMDAWNNQNIPGGPANNK